MNLRSARPARLSAVALLVLGSMAAVSSRPDAATVALQDDRVVVAHRETRFSPGWPQPVAPSTTRVSRHDKTKIRVESSRGGGRVWTASDLADHDVPVAALTAYKNAAHDLSLSDL